MPWDIKNHISLENGKYGRRAVLHSGWSDSLLEYLNCNAVCELELNQARGWHGRDLSFLAKLPNLKVFEIFDLNIRDIITIHSLHNLRQIGITTYCSSPVDFSAFPQLESCTLQWRRGAASVFECANLKELFINGYSGEGSVPFGKLFTLESLSLLNASIENLNGLRSLQRLRCLRLGNLARLESLAGIEHLVSLEELEVHTCRKVASIAEIGSLAKLRRLAINNDGNIASLKPLDQLTNLESILFYESTNIVDGDLSPLWRQKHLKRIAFKNRPHYSARREDFGDAYFR